MSTIDHVTFRVEDLGDSRALYERVFAALPMSSEAYAGAEFEEWGDFSIALASEHRPATHGVHIAFTADERERVDRWWRDLTEAGYRSDGAPGLRTQYSPDYYGAFIRDAQDNSIEAVSHDRTRHTANGQIDHLWIRVEDLDRVRRFYEAVAPVVGLEMRDHADRLQLRSAAGSFTFLEGPVSIGLHLAVGVADTQTVERFHSAALLAGARDNGGPGERPQYHPGYYGAFVIDPAGTNLEAVFHDRTGTPSRS